MEVSCACSLPPPIRNGHVRSSSGTRRRACHGRPTFHFFARAASKSSSTTSSTASGASPEMEGRRSEEHTSELQSRGHLVCRLLLEKKKTPTTISTQCDDLCTCPLL